MQLDANRPRAPCCTRHSCVRRCRWWACVKTQRPMMRAHHGGRPSIGGGSGPRSWSGRSGCARLGLVRWVPGRVRGAVRSPETRVKLSSAFRGSFLVLPSLPLAGGAPDSNSFQTAWILDDLAIRLAIGNADIGKIQDDSVPPRTSFEFGVQRLCSARKRKRRQSPAHPSGPCTRSWRPQSFPSVSMAAATL